MHHEGEASRVEARARRWWLLAVWCACTGLGLYLGWLKQPCHFDDTFIPVRYARNLLHGNGWVFNAGESINGSTSALNTLLMTALGWLTGERWVLAQVLQFGLSLGSFAFFVFLLFWRRGGAAPAAAAALLAFATPYLYWTVGLETALMLAVAAACVWSYTRGRLLLSSFLSGLLVLTRGDGALLALLLLGHFLWSGRKDMGRTLRTLARAALVFLLPLTPWLVFSFVQFGSVFPATLQAKLAHIESGVLDRPGIPYSFWWHGIDFLSMFLAIRAPGLFTGHLFLPTVVYGGLAVLGPIAAWLRRHPAGFLVGFGWFQFLAYGTLNLPNSLWYYVPFHMSVCLSVAVLFELLWMPVAHWLRIPARLVAALLLAAFLYPVFPDPLTRPRSPSARGDAGPPTPHYGIVLYDHYRDVARWIRANCPAKSSIACLEVGVLGYELADYRIVDMLGLVTKGGWRAIAAGDFTWWIFAEKPDYAVLGGSLAEGAQGIIAASPEFLRHYELVHRARAITVFRRSS